MKTARIEINGFIHASIPTEWDHDSAEVINGVKYDFWPHSNMASSGRTMVTPHVLSFDIPATFDPVTGFVANLQAEKVKLMAEHQCKLTDIDRQIQQLLAITNEATA